MERSGRKYMNLEIYLKVFVGFFFICSATISFGVTNPSDGNSLSLSLLLLLYSIMEFSLLFVCWENVGYVSRLACYVNF